MNKIKLTPFIFFGVSLLFNGCAPKPLKIYDTDSRYGYRYIDVAYTYNDFGKEVVNWYPALVLASQQCLQWGYAPPESSNDKVHQSCPTRDQAGKCLDLKIIKRYQCELTAKQKEIEYEKKAIEIAKERAEKEKAEKQAEVAKTKKQAEEIQASKQRWEAYQLPKIATRTQYIRKNCLNYQLIKQSCATAGSYDKCMEIKLNTSNESIKSIFSFGFDYVDYYIWGDWMI